MKCARIMFRAGFVRPCFNLRCIVHKMDVIAFAVSMVTKW